MSAVMAHASIRKVRRFVLVSSTARGLYEKFGFAPPAKPETFMEISVVNAYGETPSPRVGPAHDKNAA
jgi:hypothetical protein